MSTEKNKSELYGDSRSAFANLTNSEEFADLVDGLDKVSDDRLHQEIALDLEALGKAQFDDLRKFKKMRKDMVEKREALTKSIGILDKRIEITLSAIKTLQQPT